MSLMQSAPPAENEIRACFRLLLSLKPGCGKQLLACMAELGFMARLDFSSKLSIEAVSMTEWIDDVLSIVL